MADKFGLKIGVEGEKEFKNALKDINQTFKVLGSEMNLVSSQFEKQDKSIGALTARNQVLNKEIDTQKDKVSTLEKALQNASTSFGENDKRTQAWQIQLNNANADLNKMQKELNDNNKALDTTGKEFNEAEKEAYQFGDGVKDAADKADNAGGHFEKLGGVLKGIGAAMGAAMVAIGIATVGAAKALTDMTIGASTTAIFNQYQSWFNLRTAQYDKAKLDGIALNANNYTHPASHSATIITQSSTHRLVSDTEKNTWNSKADINSPNFTGTPTAPTPGSEDNSTKLATTAYVRSLGYIPASGAIDGGTF